MRRGLLPPLSGEFENEQWKNSNGAWIRSEIWACLAPGCPALAARMAREDACVDHGGGEGTLAEIFTASVESAAFVEPDRDRLIDIGLSMIPEDCGVACAIRAAIAAKQAGKDWQAARLDVIKASEDTGWFQAPRNLGYTVLGWLYGDGDFGKSLCIAVNCGDDTDCTAATLGAIFGIIHGTKGIPDKWSDPIGTSIVTICVQGFIPPKNLDELTDRTMAMTNHILAMNGTPVCLTDGPTDVSHVEELVLAAPATAQKLWALTPYQVLWSENGLEVLLDYQGMPYIQPGVPRAVRVALHNVGDNEQLLSVRMTDIPVGWDVSKMPANDIRLAPGEMLTFAPEIVTSAPLGLSGGTYRLCLEITGGKRLIRLPLTLVAKYRDSTALSP
jgi:hypothetical protein